MIAIDNAAFIRAVLGELDDDQFYWVTSFASDPSDASGTDWKGRPVAPGKPLQLDPACNNYFGVGVLRERDGKRERKADSFARLGVLVADDADRAALKRSPTWVLRTSPNKVQIGFAIKPDDPLASDKATVVRALKAMQSIGALAADQSGNSPVRLVRLPEGTNNKAKYGEPFAHELVEWHPEVQLTLAEALEAFGADATCLTRPPQFPNAEAHALGERVDLASLRDALAIIDNDGDGLAYDEFLRVAFGIHAATGGSDEGLALLMEFSERSVKHDPEYLRERMWRYIKPRADGVTAATVLGMARRARLPNADGFESLGESASEASLVPRPAPGGNNGERWPEIQPLIAKLEAEVYPLDALPDVVRLAVLEVADFVKAPVPLIATSALAAISLAIQAQVDVERAEKLSGPTGLFMLAIADSGERKSTCDGFFTRAIREHEAKTQEAAKADIQAYKTAHEAWEAQRNGLKEKIKSLSKEGKPCKAQVQELHELAAAEPKPPRVPRLIYGDTTPEALAYALAKDWPSGGIVSSEAGNVLGSHGMGKDSAMRNFATLNQLWDGASLPIERRSSESFTVRGARLTMALQVQESTLRAFCESTKGLARGTGFLARFLLCWPVSTQGTRYFTEAPKNWPNLAAFNSRLTALLDQAVPIDDDGALNPAMLKLSPEAKDAWIAFHDSIEAELSSGRDFHDVRDVASKTADNAARLAALFHTFAGKAGPIDLGAMESAARIAAWHLHEARRFLGELAMPAELTNPARLECWLLDYCRREGTDSVPTREIQRCGPNGLRDKSVIVAAIKELAELGRARLATEGKRKAAQLNPALLARVKA